MSSVDLSWFVPLPKQLEFLRCSAKESMYAGGFGSGKTICGGLRGVITSLQYPGTEGLVGRMTYRALKDTTQKVILDGDDKPPLIPPELIKHVDNDGQAATVTLVNGSRILFRSFQDFSITKVRSLNLGWFYLDEATESSEKIWLELVGRLRRPDSPRIGWGTTNPNGHDWVWSRFHPDGPGEPAGPLIHAPTTENTYLAADYIQSLLAMPDEWVKRFVRGSFDSAAGQIWDEWDRAVHVVPTVGLPVEWRRFEALDHGRRNPTAYLQIAVDGDGNLWVEREYYQPGLLAQHAAAIRVLRGDRRQWSPIIADPSIFAKDANGNSIADQYRKKGLQMKPGANDVSGGLLRVSEFLHREEDAPFPAHHPLAGTLGPDDAGAPRLFVMDCCTNLIGEIPSYVWKDLSPSQEEKIDQPEQPRKLRDHAADALRYACMSQPRPAAVHDPNRQIEQEKRRAKARDDVPPILRVESKDRGRARSAGLRDRSF